MTNCPTCGRTVPSTDRFCAGCGAVLGTADPRATGSYHPENPSPMFISRERIRFAPGQVLAGRYRIVNQLGKGGMGEVYRADDLALGQPVALKFLPPSFTHDPDRLACFRKEVASARKVSHPNVCRVYDIAEHDGQPFLTMEYIDGEDLASLLRRIGRLPEDKAAEISRQLCAALGAVHEQDLLHRDLKPANVMLDGRGRVRLTDFGLAAVAEGVPHEDIRSGTPMYMAPEQLEGTAVTARSDLFALGLVLYEIFTGKKAFPANSRQELERQYAEATPSKPSSYVSGLDPAAEQIILRCLEPEPRNRPRSAHEVLAALPGGDPLEAARAAGQVPSPALVAEAGGTGSIPTWVGALLLGGILAGLVLFAWLTDHTGLHRRLPLKDPTYLRGKAQKLLEDLGYPAPADFAEGILADHETLYKARDKQEGWQGLQTGRPAVLFYWYRHSLWPLVQRKSPNDILGYGIPGMVTGLEPPLGSGEKKGEALVILDGHGRLIELHARPPLGSNTVSEQVWSLLIKEAGLDTCCLAKVEPERDTGAFVQEHLARTGEAPERPGHLLSIEAGFRDGQPVYFWVGEKGTADRMTVEDIPPDIGTQLSEYVYAGIRLAALTVGAWLAWRNFRSGLTNLSGALRLALVYVGAYLLMWLFMAHHVANLADEWAILTAAVGLALVNGLTLFLIYLALEPSVRRLRPECVIGWNRLLEGRWRDPLVGRDVLIGGLFGVIWALLTPVRRTLVPEILGQPFLPYPIWMPPLTQGPLGPIFAYVWVPIFFQLLEFFLLVVVYLLTRRLSVAAGVWGLFWTVRWSLFLGAELPGSAVALAAILALAALAAGLAVLTLLRFGLLAFVAFGAFGFILIDLPITLDRQAWYLPTSLCVLTLLSGLAVYAFFISKREDKRGYVGRPVPQPIRRTPIGG